MNPAEALVNLFRPVNFRGKVRLVDRFVPRTGSRTAVVAGYWVELDLSEHIQRKVYLGVYERWETRVIRRALRPGMCFLDVGANIGYFSLLASRRVGPSGRVVAVEPSRYAADKLAATLARNQIANVRLERLGLGAEPGEVTLFDPDPDNHTPTMLGEPGAAGTVVPVRRLDDCLDGWGIKVVDLLKIDVEGFEAAVFCGAESAFRSGRIRAILCEFNAHWLGRAGTTPAELRECLLQHGFTDETGSRWDPAAPLSNRFFRATGR